MTLSQDNPVSGTQYGVGQVAGRRVRILSMAAKCTWTVQPTPLEVWLIIDGISWRFYVDDPVSNTWYSACLNSASISTSQTLSTTLNEASRSFLIEGRNVTITAEITGGTVSNLAARVKYAII